MYPRNSEHPKRLMKRALGVLLSLGLALAASRAAAIPLPRDALWLVVRSCVLAQRTVGTPFPCLQVLPATADAPGYAVLRVPDSSTHILVTPITHVPGLESPELLWDSAGVYWRAALASRRLVAEGAGGRVSADAVGLAVNSIETRSQDQLHIHAACFRPNVLAILRANAAPADPGWHPIRRLIGGERYWARAVTKDEFATANLFALLSTVPGAGGDLSRSKVLLVEAGNGFVIAVTRSSQRTVEHLIDDSCSGPATG